MTSTTIQERCDLAIANVTEIGRAFPAMATASGGDLSAGSFWNTMLAILEFIRENADNAEQILDAIDMIATMTGQAWVKTITSMIRQMLGMI